MVKTKNTHAVGHCPECRMEFATHYGAAAHGAFAKHGILYRPMPKDPAAVDKNKHVMSLRCLQGKCEVCTPKGHAVVIKYTNHRGETADRHIVPICIRFGSTEWHPEQQWLLEAFDLDRDANRAFALRDVLQWRKLA